MSVLRPNVISGDYGYCHPPQAKRTKCKCGDVVELRRVETRCDCGRWHVREPEAPAFRSLYESGGHWSRPGGRAGCPGVTGDPYPAPEAAPEQTDGEQP